MNSAQGSGGPTATGTPPTVFAGLPEAKRSWPIVLGVISSIYALLMLPCNGCGLFTPQIYRWMYEYGARAGEADTVLEVELRVTEQLQVLFIVQSSLGIATSVWLLIAAVALLRRRAWSRITLMAWSLVELLLTFASIAIQVIMTQMTVRTLLREAPGQDVGQVWLECVLTICFMLVFSAALPVFLLFWLSRGRIKAEMAPWR